MIAGSPSRVLENPTDVNLLENTEDLAKQFDLLCSATESTSLRNLSDAGLSRCVEGMALRVSFCVYFLCFNFFCFLLTLFLFFFLDLHAGD